MRATICAILTTLTLASPAAHAVYKCQSNGTTSYQANPCSGPTKAGQQLNIRSEPQGVMPSGDRPATQPSPQKSPTSAGNEKQALEQMARERQIREANYEIENLERRIANRSEQMTREMDSLRAQKARANNNLAGATWEQSLSTEMQAVAARYKVMNDVDQEQIKALRVKVTMLQSGKP